MANIRTGRKSGFIIRNGVKRRETLWIGDTATTPVGLAGANTAVLINSLGALALALRPFTIVRTRGVVVVRTDQIAASEDVDLAYGQVVVSDQAVAIGITALPTPSTDSDSDLFFVYERLMNSFFFGTGVGFDGKMFVEREIDSRAMRKVEDGQDLVAVAETGVSSSGVVFAQFSRTLIKVH